MFSIETTKELWKDLAKRLNGELIFCETVKANFNYGIKEIEKFAYLFEMITDQLQKRKH